MLQSPPTLGCPSKTKLAETNGPISQAIEAILSRQGVAFQGVVFQGYDPSGGTTSCPKGKRATKACDLCAKKHTKCHGAISDAVCTIPKCTCLYHNAPREQSPSSPSLAYLEDTPSTVIIRAPGLIPTRHFAGETSFIPYISRRYQPKMLVEEVPISMPDPPAFQRLERENELYLIDVYCDNISPYFPLVNRSDLREQYNLIEHNKPCYLSPLFFFALFARAAYIADQTWPIKGRTFKEAGDQYLEYAIYLRSFYQTQPSVSTVLALVILANHLEQKKVYSGITRSWILSGEAFRMVIDSGLHRMCSLDENEVKDQLCIRAFWLAYVTDCTISLCYGRPSSVEEKLLDVVPPSVIAVDDDLTKCWVQALGEIVTFSKIAVRIVRFNYSPPPPFLIDGPIKRHNAFLASMDSWLTDLRYPLYQESESEDQITDSLRKRLIFQKNIFFLLDLILLHRPYSTGTSKSNPSLAICIYASAEIIFSSYELNEPDFAYHASSSLLAYALVLALQIQLTNAAEPNDSKHDIKLCELGLEVLSKLPQRQFRDCILTDVLDDLSGHFFYRRPPVAHEEEAVYLSQNSPKQTMHTVQFIFGTHTSPIISTDPEPSTTDNIQNKKFVSYNPNSTEKKTRTPSQTRRYGKCGKKQKGKQKQHLQKETVFSSASTSKSTTQSPPEVNNACFPPVHDQHFTAVHNVNPTGLFLDNSQEYWAHQYYMFCTWCIMNGIDPSAQQSDIQMNHLAFDIHNINMTEPSPMHSNNLVDELPIPEFLCRMFPDPTYGFVENDRVGEYCFQQEDFNDTSSQQQQQQYPPPPPPPPSSL